jgi:hypothetical protein
MRKYALPWAHSLEKRRPDNRRVTEVRNSLEPVGELWLSPCQSARYLQKFHKLLWASRVPTFIQIAREM